MAIWGMMQPLRLALALITLCLAGILAGGSTASAASSCPTLTFLSYGHLAYEATAIPAGLGVPVGSGIGSGTIDQPTNSNGCRRAQSTVAVQAAGSIRPQVAVLVRSRPRLLFVIGHRCQGFAGSAYWSCLLSPLVFAGQQFTAISYPVAPGTRKTVPLGAAIGPARYQGHKVTVRRLEGVAPSLAVGISGQPSTAFVSPRTCPYSGFSNNPQYDNLLRCLRSPVWFTFDPPGNEVGATVVGRSDRPLAASVKGAPVGLVSLPLVADYVPSSHVRVVPVGQVGEQVSVNIPNVNAGLYEAVVSCPHCGSGGVGGLYPAGSILVTAKAKGSSGIQIISYVLAALVVVAAFFAIRTYRRRPRRDAGG